MNTLEIVFLTMIVIIWTSLVIALIYAIFKHKSDNDGCAVCGDKDGELYGIPWIINRKFCAKCASEILKDNNET